MASLDSSVGDISEDFFSDEKERKEFWYFDGKQHPEFNNIIKEIAGYTIIERMNCKDAMKVYLRDHNISLKEAIKICVRKMFERLDMEMKEIYGFDESKEKFRLDITPENVEREIRLALNYIDISEEDLSEVFRENKFPHIPFRSTVVIGFFGDLGEDLRLLFMNMIHLMIEHKIPYYKIELILSYLLSFKIGGIDQWKEPLTRLHAMRISWLRLFHKSYTDFPSLFHSVMLGKLNTSKKQVREVLEDKTYVNEYPNIVSLSQILVIERDGNYILCPSEIDEEPDEAYMEKNKTVISYDDIKLSMDGSHKSIPILESVDTEDAGDTEDTKEEKEYEFSQSTEDTEFSDLIKKEYKRDLQILQLFFDDNYISNIFDIQEYGDKDQSPFEALVDSPSLSSKERYDKIKDKMFIRYKVIYKSLVHIVYIYRDYTSRRRYDLVIAYYTYDPRDQNNTIYLNNAKISDDDMKYMLDYVLDVSHHIGDGSFNAAWIPGNIPRYK